LRPRTAIFWLTTEDYKLLRCYIISQFFSPLLFNRQSTSQLTKKGHDLQTKNTNEEFKQDRVYNAEEKGHLIKDCRENNELEGAPKQDYNKHSYNP
jgi:hypothetical protein